MDEKTVTSNCATHGEYEARLIRFTTHDVPTRCPSCAELRRQALEAEDRSRLINSLLSGCGVPSRFVDKSLPLYDAKLPGQRAAKREIADFLEAWPSVPSFILIGGLGTGKTHLLCAAVITLCRREYRARYITAADYLRTIRATWERRNRAEDSEAEILNAFASVDFLAVDEVGATRGSEDERRILFELINARYEAELPTALAGNVERQELAENFIGERAFDRLREGGGRVIVFDWPSFRGRAPK